MLNSSSLTYDEMTYGDPWTVIPIKTRKFAKECTDIVLSKTKIKALKNFDNFENLEALWLNNNKLYHNYD
jgi:hypothetical protein